MVLGFNGRVVLIKNFQKKFIIGMACLVVSSACFFTSTFFQEQKQQMIASGQSVTTQELFGPDLWSIVRNFGYLFLCAACVCFFIHFLGACFKSHPEVQRLVVLWLFGGILCALFLFTPKTYQCRNPFGNIVGYIDESRPNCSPVLRWDLLIPAGVSVVVVGFLTLHTISARRRLDK